MKNFLDIDMNFKKNLNHKFMKYQLFLSYSAGYLQTFEEFVEFAYRQGFFGVEFIPDLPPNLPEQLDNERIKTLKKLKSEYNLHYTVHSIFMDINPTSLVPKVKQLAFDLTLEILTFAKNIEAEAVIIHPGYRFTPWRERPEQAKLFEKIQKDTYLKLAEESTRIEIPIFIENGSYYLSARKGKRKPLHIGINADELLSIAKIPSKSPFGICLDIGKAYLSSTKCSENEVLNYLERITPLLCEVQLNTFTGYQKVIPLVLAYLKSINFKGPIVLECSKEKIKTLSHLVAKWELK
jgi:sugar phosphate isomerase/epimerase